MTRPRSSASVRHEPESRRQEFPYDVGRLNLAFLGFAFGRCSDLIRRRHPTLSPMKIEVYRSPSDHFREIAFFDAENEESRAYSGLLDREEALEVAHRLREVAQELTAWAHEAVSDQKQTVLPLFEAFAA